MNASDVMVRDVVTVGPDEDVSKAVKLLVDHDISALPVIDSERRVIGVLSEADFIHREKIGTAKRRVWWLEAIISRRKRDRRAGGVGPIPSNRRSGPRRDAPWR
jgi:CBS-domain-containing membrane protein